ncbi:MAG: ABC transporter permease subunit [Nitrososphaerales archaeon]
MTNPFVYDVKKTITSKSVLLLIAVIVLIGFAIIPAYTPAGSSQPGLNDNVFAYYDSAGYHFLAFTWNQFGQPVSGVDVQLNFTDPTGTHSGSAVTNSSGAGQASIPATANVNAAYALAVQQPGGYESISSGQQAFWVYTQNGSQLALPGQTVLLLGSGTVTQVTDGQDSSRQDILVNWVADFGKEPSGSQAYYKFVNASSDGGFCIDCFTYPLKNLTGSGMLPLGTLDSFRQTFGAPPLEPHLADGSTVFVQVFLPNGTGTDAYATFLVASLYPQPPPPVSQSQANSNAIGFFENLFGLFIPLVAIAGSYDSYGKDRVSGVLESVLAQPISRRSLSLSRYLSSFAAMAVAVVVAVGVVDLITFHYSGLFVASNVILPSTAAFMVELAAFIGIMMALSRLLRSSGSLVGLGIGLFIIFDFFWGFLLVLLAYVTKIGMGSVPFIRLFIGAEFLNPAQFIALVDTYLTHSVSSVVFSFGGSLIIPSDYGVTVWSIAATGALWIAIPLAAFLYLSTRRD